MTGMATVWPFPPRSIPWEVYNLVYHYDTIYYHSGHTDHDHYCYISNTWYLCTLYTSSFIAAVSKEAKGSLHRACPYPYFSAEWWNGGWKCSVEARLWIWRLLALVLWLLFAQCHLVSGLDYHAQFQPCVSNRIPSQNLQEWPLTEIVAYAPYFFTIIPGIDRCATIQIMRSPYS